MAELHIPAGFRFAGLASGIKTSGKPDLGLIVADRPAACAGVFTGNRVVAAPVQVSRPLIRAGRCQAILVNSGNANACTGADGLQRARDCAMLTARELELSEDLVAVSSTGVIGAPLPWEPFARGIPQLVTGLQTTRAPDVAEAMRTTDAFAKMSSAHESGDPEYRLLGLAKGAGMIHPDMATMLAFVMTDARLSAEVLDELLRPAVMRSFNAITVDGDTSTNDMVLLLASGAAPGPPIGAGSAAAERFAAHLERVLVDLARMIVRDGEGASKLVTVRVTEAADESAARQVARSVATSTLVKTAFFGADPNWGRIIAAVGYAGVPVDGERIDILFDEIPVALNSLSTGAEREKQAAEVLQRDEFEVTIRLHQGTAQSSYYTSDLGYEYVRINADYRT